MPIVVNGKENPLLLPPLFEGSASLSRAPEAVGIATYRPETEIVNSYSPSDKPSCSVSSVPSRRTNALSEVNDNNNNNNNDNHKYNNNYNNNNNIIIIIIILYLNSCLKGQILF